MLTRQGRGTDALRWLDLAMPYPSNKTYGSSSLATARLELLHAQAHMAPLLALSYREDDARAEPHLCTRAGHG